MTPLYPRLVGGSWDRLPERIRRCHTGGAETRAFGYFDVAWGRGAPARWLASLGRLRRPGKRVPTELTVTRSDGAEIWRRTFAGVDFTTRQWEEDGLLIERVGSIELSFRLGVVNDRLTFEQRGASVRLGGVRLRIPVPIAPRVSACVWDEDGMRVHVEVSFPVVGSLCRYQGSLTESIP